MGTMASQITSLMIVYSIVYSGADQRKHKSSVSLAFVRGIHPRSVNSPHKGPVTWNMLPFDDIIMSLKFVSKIRINSILEFVQIMAWHQPGTKPLSEPIMVTLLTHIVTYMRHLASMSWTPVSHGVKGMQLNCKYVHENNKLTERHIWKWIW